MKATTITLDFETYYDPSIRYGMGPRGMEAEEYIRDGRFQCLGMAIAIGAGEPRWVTGRKVPALLSRLPWSDLVAIAHNAQFDGLILHHHFGHRPMRWFCTKAMARHALVPLAGPDGKRLSYSLASLCRHFGLGEKMEISHAGRRLEDLESDPYLEERLAEYAKRDVVLTRALFAKLAPSLPREESRVVDRVVRMTTEPVLRYEEPGVSASLEDGDEHRANTLARVGSRGPVPANLDYHGQHTGKFSGGGGYNLPGAHKHGKARHALRGATGQWLVTADMRGLELRVLMALAGQMDVVGALGRGEDVYADFAWQLFDKPGTQPWAELDIPANAPEQVLTPAELKVGKDTVLGCGYGMGEKALASRLTSLVDNPVRVANLAVAQYRKRFPKVTRFWRAAREAMVAASLSDSDESAPKREPFTFVRDVSAPFPTPALVLPSGRRLNYPGLRIGAGGRARYDRYGREEMLPPAKLVANVVSAYSRDLVCDWMLRSVKRAPYATLVLVVIDELVFSCPRDRTSEMATVLFEEAKRLPGWADQALALEARVMMGETWGTCADALS